MDGLEKLDHTHAIFSGFTSIWKRMFLFCACGVFGQFVGANIFNAPKFLGKVLTTGPAALADLRPMDLAWLPMEWAGTVLGSTFCWQTMLYVPVLMVAFLTLMHADELKIWPLAVLGVGQPIDAWLLKQTWESNRLVGGDLGISLALLVIYTALASGGYYWWWRLREDNGE